MVWFGSWPRAKLEATSQSGQVAKQIFHRLLVLLLVIGLARHCGVHLVRRDLCETMPDLVRVHPGSLHGLGCFRHKGRFSIRDLVLDDQVKLDVQRRVDLLTAFHHRHALHERMAILWMLSFNPPKPFVPCGLHPALNFATS